MVDVASWVCLVVVGFVCACVIHPIHITLPSSGRIATMVLIPHCLRGVTVTLNDLSAPPIGVVVLRFFDVLPLGDLVTSLISVGGVKPWQVLLIFFTLAYASISVDMTGFSKYVALRTLRTFHGSRNHGSDIAGCGGIDSHSATIDRRHAPVSSTNNLDANSADLHAPTTLHSNATTTNTLLIVVYLLSGVLALIASNDVVVLTLTPVLIHFCRSNKIDPIPVLLVEYYAANTWSSFLEIGNPTNIILGQGLNISFVDYLKVSVIPTTVTILSSVGFVAMMPAPAPTTHVVQCGAPSGESTDVEMTAPSEVVVDPSFPTPNSTSSGNDDTSTSIPPPLEVVPAELADPFGAKFGSSVLAVGILLLCLSSYIPSIPLAAVTTVMCVVLCIRDCAILSTDPDEYLLGVSRIVQVGRRMPWGVAPYAVCMFILVDALERNQWIDTLATSFVSLCRLGGLVVASTTMMGLTILIVNLLNNQPAAILLSTALVMTRDILLLDADVVAAASTNTSTSYPTTTSTSSSSMVIPITQPQHRAVEYAKEEFSGIVSAVALGANIGACFTVAGALAGFMWLAILREHHIGISWVAFAVAGAKFMVIPAVLGGIASGLQSWVGMGL